MLAAGAGGSGEDQRKRKTERDRNHYKSTGLCSQRQGGGGVAWGRGGALPGRSEAVGSGTNQEKHDPSVDT